MRDETIENVEELLNELLIMTNDKQMKLKLYQIFEQILENYEE